MKLIIALLFVFLVLSGIASMLDAPAAADRAAAQRALLVELQRVNTPAATQLADEWRETYPRPTDENLTELQLVVDRVKADPASAVDYTAAEKRRKLAERSFSPVVSFGSDDPKPGL